MWVGSFLYIFLAFAGVICIPLGKSPINCNRARECRSIQMQIDENKYYPLNEAAAMLGVKEATVKKYCRTKGKGNLAGKQVGPNQRWVVLGRGIIAKRKEWHLDD